VMAKQDPPAWSRAQLFKQSKRLKRARMPSLPTEQDFNRLEWQARLEMNRTKARLGSEWGW
jgi:hypothetical protein